MTKPARVNRAGLIVLQYANRTGGPDAVVFAGPLSLPFSLFRDDNLRLHAQDFLKLDRGLKIAQIGQGQSPGLAMHDFLGVRKHLGQQDGNMRMRVDHIADTFNQCGKLFHDNSE